MNALTTILPAIAITVSVALTTAHSYANSDAGEEPVGTFSNGSLDGWKQRSFDGNTTYELVESDGIDVLKAHTEGQASVLYRKKTIDLQKTPMIEWSWKVNNTYEGLDEKTRKGDDFPARLYVVAKVGLLPWDTLAINYVWASDVETGDTWLNPFTEKAIMVAVESGDANLGKWSTHTRNVAKDFQGLFGRDIGKIDGYAVMVDGDNSGQEGTAWFGEISFMSPGH